MREDLAALNERLAVDPLLKERVGDLVETVQALGDRVGTLSGIVGETAGRRAGRETEIAALDERLGEVGARVDDVARELRLEIEALAVTSADGGAPVVGAPLLEGRMEFFAEQLARLEIVVDDAAGAAEQVGIELRGEISALAAAVERERIDLEQATHEWEASTAHTGEVVRSLREDLAALNERLAVDPLLKERVGDLVETVQALGDRVGTLSGIVGETAGRRAGRETEIAALDERLGEVGARVDDVARELRLEIEALAVTSADGGAPVVGAPLLEGRMEFFAEQLARLEIVVDDAAGAAEQVGIELRGEISALAAAVERERIDLEQATHEWEARRAALEERMDELAVFAASTAERGVDEVGRALHTLAERLERLEHDRQEVASEATNAESTWAVERVELEARLDAIAAAITEERPQAPEVAHLIAELSGRLARMEGERETVADLAALAETWTHGARRARGAGRRGPLDARSAPR